MRLPEHDLMPFFENLGQKISLRKHSKLNRCGTTKSRNIIDDYVKKKILLERKVGKYFYHELNAKSLDARSEAQGYYRAWIGTLLRSIKMILRPELVVFTGEIPRLTATAGSSIDVVVVGAKRKEMGLRPYERFYGRKINLMVFESVGDVPPELLLGGIVCYEK